MQFSKWALQDSLEILTGKDLYKQFIHKEKINFFF